MSGRGSAELLELSGIALRVAEEADRKSVV